MIWAVVLGAGLGCYLLKLAGLSVPARVLDNRVLSQVADLIPVALLSALIAVQVLGGPAGSLVLDARLTALVAAAALLFLRAPFLVVVFGAALVAALVRLL